LIALFFATPSWLSDMPADAHEGVTNM